jgi:hypothetical protein
MSSDVTVLPLHGEVFTDARGGDRTLRVNWHGLDGPDALVVLSLWRDTRCVGTFRLRARDVLLLIDVLVRGAGGSPTPGAVNGARWHEGHESWPPDRDATPEAGSWSVHLSPTQRLRLWPPNSSGAGSRSA